MTIKDKVFKRLFIPFLGVSIPFVSGLLTWQNVSLLQLFFSLPYFIFISYVVWSGAFTIVAYARMRLGLRKNIFIKLLTLSACSAAYNVLVIFSSCFLWQLLVYHAITLPPVVKAVWLSAGAVVVITLIYESVFLTTERELDKRILRQLDQEKKIAETNILSNELDPHFFFNCLNSLSHLVKTDQTKATAFIRSLANVFKYFLLNKGKDRVLLADELAFLDDYFFLQKIRFDDAIRIDVDTSTRQQDYKILPCTLQLLVENAIKHNFFSEEAPLQILIRVQDSFLVVSNPVKPKLRAAESTKTGLRNVEDRYWLLLRKQVTVEWSGNEFTVRLPLIK